MERLSILVFFACAKVMVVRKKTESLTLQVEVTFLRSKYNELVDFDRASLILGFPVGTPNPTEVRVRFVGIQI